MFYFLDAYKVLCTSNNLVSSSLLILSCFCIFFLSLIQYYESLLMEAKSKIESSISEAVEKAVNLKMQDIQSKLEKSLEEKKAVAYVSLLLAHLKVISSFSISRLIF